MIDRIKQVMKYKQMSPTAFADSINVNRSSVTHIFTGRNQPSLDVAKKILKAFPEISSDWLIMGLGAMFREVPSPAISSPATASTVDITQQPSKTADHLQPDLFADLEDVASENEKPSASPISAAEIDNPRLKSVSAAEQADNTIVEETVRISRRGRSGETHIPDLIPKRERILKSQTGRHLVHVVFFFSDRTCEVYSPS